MKGFIVALFLLIRCISHGATFAEVDWTYGPFEKGEKVERLDLKSLKWASNVRNEEYGNSFLRGHAFAPDERTRFSLTHDGASYLARVTRDGKEVMAKTRCSQNSPFYSQWLQVGDLNGDEEPDFMLPFTTGGCGGGAWAHDVVMILSANGRYRVTKIPTYGGDCRNYFVRIAGKPCYVHQAFNYESRCKDGKSHSFFIYNLYEIKGDGIRLGNHLHPDFPRIVWFSFKPNNRETDLLSEEQKKILLRKSFPDVQWHGGFVKRTPPEHL